MSRPALLLAGLLAATTLAAAPQPDGGSYQRIEGGVLVTPASGPARHVRLTVHGDGIIHVVAGPRTDLPGETSLIAGDYTVTAGAGHVFLRTARDSITRFGNPRPYGVASR